MHIIEYCLGNAMVCAAEDGFSIKENLGPARTPALAYDLDLIYVECRLCGKPVIWEKGKTRLLLESSGIDVTLLDAECMIVSDGCPQCRLGTTLFQLSVVRVTAFSAQDVLFLSENRGNA